MTSLTLNFFEVEHGMIDEYLIFTNTSLYHQVWVTFIFIILTLFFENKTAAFVLYHKFLIRIFH